MESVMSKCHTCFLFKKSQLDSTSSSAHLAKLCFSELWFVSADFDRGLGKHKPMVLFLGLCFFYREAEDFRIKLHIKECCLLLAFNVAAQISLRRACVLQLMSNTITCKSWCPCICKSNSNSQNIPMGQYKVYICIYTTVLIALLSCNCSLQVVLRHMKLIRTIGNFSIRDF